MKSVIAILGSEEFPRIRVGIGMPEFKGDLINYVISKIKPEDYIELLQGIEIAVQATEEILKNGINESMNKIN